MELASGAGLNAPDCVSVSPNVDATSSLPSSGGKGTSCGQRVGVIPFLKMRCGLTSVTRENGPRFIGAHQRCRVQLNRSYPPVGLSFNEANNMDTGTRRR
ncbi:hypothetical protein ALC56_06557 [Trachymyrmex septentrionalis]|uniref:Uncharacterized protein n=1 Tax=Trachymyrmex septentrionalis TaxID=34720 RepID=A0A195FFK1_9HYME|nr:hypothetical protein ALC56_06557 [Trachymyrmex septentrionalis]